MHTRHRDLFKYWDAHSFFPTLPPLWPHPVPLAAVCGGSGEVKDEKGWWEREEAWGSVELPAKADLHGTLHSTVSSACRGQGEPRRDRSSSQPWPTWKASLLETSKEQMGRLLRGSLGAAQQSTHFCEGTEASCRALDLLVSSLPCFSPQG